MDPILDDSFREQLIERRMLLEEASRRRRADPSLVRLLRDVDAALERLKNGNFGFCEVCHDPIEAERLLADPLICLCLDHLSRDQQRALEHDLDLASRIQRRLLPTPDLQLPGWEFAFTYRPAGPVSGDYCDVLLAPEGEGEVLFLLGDVSGKGIAASMLVNQLHALFRGLRALSDSLAEVMERANRLFCESSLASHYATLAAARTFADGAVEVCNAGHLPPLVIRRDGAESLDSTGLPLGLFCDSTYQLIRTRLDRGDRLLLFTDGLSEAEGPHGEYGLERVHNAATRGWDQSPNLLNMDVLEDHRQFLQGSPVRDDLTLLSLGRI